MLSRSALTLLCCTQLSLIGLQHQRAFRPVVAHPKHPEGLSQLVNRIAGSKYGLLDPLPEAAPAPTASPQAPENQVPSLEAAPVEVVPSPLVPAERPEGAPGWLWPILEEESRQRGLDPYLIESVVRQESGFNPLAVSPVGAQGLMQLMPDTAELVGVRDVFDPRQNVSGGTTYLAWQLQDFGGDLKMALAAYNAGPGAVRRWGGVPPYQETHDYIRHVMEDYRRKVQTESPPMSVGDSPTGL